ncbi:DUF1360 domain-containing protein [Mesobacillus harenae]|uniref:DUF1360 domain-containing protein n=1 Tax=Mesobacillus harenae TaxID=2213203 RepID=UPI001580579A|nr:DUF1360 domain-containing protein [Mesobacillus harenae]
MEVNFLLLLMFSFASFRLTRLLIYDRITEFIRKPFLDEIHEQNQAGEVEVFLSPKQAPIRGFLGELLTCYWCTGFWVSLGLFLIYYLWPWLAEPLLVILAVSGMAGLIETFVQKNLTD